jgi:hypothetical protein
MWRLTAFAFGVALLAGAGRAADVVVVPPGGDLQHALERARPGDVILLAPGATYSGNFVLPVKSGTQFITIRTAHRTPLPIAGQRIGPTHAPYLAKLNSPNRQPALSTAPGAHHWRLQLLEFSSTADDGGDLVALGDGSDAQRLPEQVPYELIVDRCYIHGLPGRPQKRGIALNSATTSIVDSYIADIKLKGQDAQAIAGWNGPGPYTIENNYLEASGENFMLGGADASIPGLVAQDVVFRRNHLSKPLVWREEGWVVKNLFELKSARRVLVEANLFEYSWAHGQAGYAILLTPRNQDGGAPWATVEDITIRRNIVRHAGAGLQIIGADTDHPSGPTRRITISDNLFYDINHEAWGGNGAFALVGNSPSDITIVHNTIYQSGNILMADGGTKEAPATIPRFRFADNIARHNLYGVHGSDRAVGGDTLTAYFPSADFRSNGIGGGDSRLYPGGNLFISEEEFERQFENVAAADFRLRANSRFRGRGTSGTDLGADVAALMRILALAPVGK